MKKWIFIKVFLFFLYLTSLLERDVSNNIKDGLKYEIIKIFNQPLYL